MGSRDWTHFSRRARAGTSPGNKAVSRHSSKSRKSSPMSLFSNLDQSSKNRQHQPIWSCYCIDHPKYSILRAIPVIHWQPTSQRRIESTQANRLPKVKEMESHRRRKAAPAQPSDGFYKTMKSKGNNNLKIFKRSKRSFFKSAMIEKIFIFYK